MPLRYCENPERCRIFCGRLEDVGEAGLSRMSLRLKVLSRSSEVRVFLTMTRSWDLASCMCVEGGVQGGPVEVLVDEGRFGTRI